jgi:hypothetical protein
MDSAPSGIELNPAEISKIFKNGFELQDSAVSRRRIVKSRWYWLARK